MNENDPRLAGANMLNDANFKIEDGYARLRADIDAILSHIAFLHSLHGWPIEDGNPIKDYITDKLAQHGVEK